MKSGGIVALLSLGLVALAAAIYWPWNSPGVHDALLSSAGTFWIITAGVLVVIALVAWKVRR